jgi:hypothetical protein
MQMGFVFLTSFSRQCTILLFIIPLCSEIKRISLNCISQTQISVVWNIFSFKLFQDELLSYFCPRNCFFFFFFFSLYVSVFFQGPFPRQFSRMTSSFSFFLRKNHLCIFTSLSIIEITLTGKTIFLKNKTTKFEYTM